MSRARSRLRVAAVVLGLVAAGLAGCAPSAVGGLATPSAAPTATPAPTDSAPPPSSPNQPSACPTDGGGGGVSSKVSYADPSQATTETTGTTAATATQARNAQRAGPWKDRPVVKLCFDVPADRRVVQGTEQVVFTPDRRTCEVVFRTWPNKPETASFGNRLDVTSAAVGGAVVTPKVEAAGAPTGTPGTLVRLPVKGCIAAGKKATIDLAFTLTLGADTPERVGYSTEDRTAWLATAYPLLAWERGRGWVTDPAVRLFGETVTSEEFRLAQLDVVAPRADQVLGTGRSMGTEPSSRSGSVVHRFSADAVRDVAVTVGRMELVERTVDGVRLHVGAPTIGTSTPVAEWADSTEAAMKELSTHLGPFPYADLWVSIVPDITSGIEFPGAIQFGDVDMAGFPQLVPHEVAHMWFYGLVGNNQARDPWLDESFAEYAEALTSGDLSARMTFVAPTLVHNKVGESMRWYDALGNPDLYGAGVYRQGGAMLLRARQAAGSATFDRLLRDYIDTNAHRIVTDQDVAKAFASEPEVLRVFREFGALPR